MLFLAEARQLNENRAHGPEMLFSPRGDDPDGEKAAVLQQFDSLEPVLQRVLKLVSPLESFSEGMLSTLPLPDPQTRRRGESPLGSSRQWTNFTIRSLQRTRRGLRFWTKLLSELLNRTLFLRLRRCSCLYAEGILSPLHLTDRSCNISLSKPLGRLGRRGLRSSSDFRRCGISQILCYIL